MVKYYDILEQYTHTSIVWCFTHIFMILLCRIIESTQRAMKQQIFLLLLLLLLFMLCNNVCGTFFMCCACFVWMFGNIFDSIAEWNKWINPSTQYKFEPKDESEQTRWIQGMLDRIDKCSKMTDYLWNSSYCANEIS